MSPASAKSVQRGRSVSVLRALPFERWPVSDRAAWDEARRPPERLRRGGAGSHLTEITRQDLTRRYGYFLHWVEQREGLDQSAAVAFYVTKDRVERYAEEIKERLSSVTVYGSIYKLRRMAQLLASKRDYKWLIELENDLAFLIEPQSKLARMVYSQLLLEAGFRLMAEAEVKEQCSELGRARKYRNGLMVALLALHPIRLKNYYSLEIGSNFCKVDQVWWILLSAAETKEGRADERQLDYCLHQWVDRYVAVHHAVLARGCNQTKLWLSSNTGNPLGYSGVEKLISSTTFSALGVDVSPHLFRSAGATTAAMYAGDMPHLPTALLHHRDPATAEAHYNRATTFTAARSYADLMRTLQRTS